MIPLEWLTAGERAVYERRTAGMTNAAAAAELGITRQHAAVNYVLARRRIARGGPPARARRAARDVDAALRRFDALARAERAARERSPERLSIYALACSSAA